MPSFGPIRRRDLIAALHRAGFSGLHYGRKHHFMSRGGKDVYIPNPHQGDISIGLLKKVLYQAGISREEWEKL